MKKCCLTLLMAVCLAGVNALVKSLTDIQASQSYLLKNANGYGYCVYAADRATGTDSYGASNYLTLAGATVDHPEGSVNTAYHDAVDTGLGNNLWTITSDGKGAYFLLNVGQQQYASNIYTMQWGDYAYTQNTNWLLTATPTPVLITEIAEGLFAFQTEADANASRYLCAASQQTNAIANWTIDDLGSAWQIIDPNNITDTTTTIVPPEPDKPDVTPEEEVEDSLGTVRYFTFKDGQLVAIPERYILGREEAGDTVKLTLTGDTVWSYMRGHLASEDTVYYAAQPSFLSFKFNNKYNDQLFTDAFGIIDDSLNRVDVDVACIGKRLTPSFQVPEGVTVWIGGQQQHSKVTSRRFERDAIYTLAYPKNYIYKVTKVSDEVWTTPEASDTEDEWLATQIPLTADMLSTNAPSNHGENPANLLDGNTETIFHTTWGTGQYEKLPWQEGATYGDGQSEWPYLQIDLTEPIDALKFCYTTRNQSNYAPLGFILQGSNDGTNWTDAYTLTPEKDNLPQGANEEYTSPVISLGDKYSQIRLQLTASSHKNYLVMSEFSLYKVEPNPDYGREDTTFVPQLIHPAVYTNAFLPFGRNYRVHVNYLTDAATSLYRVPTLRITTLNGTLPTSKDYYWDATFELDGAGVWPDLRVDSMQIKGRGNSSWSGGYNKEPYRLKFPAKIKPFGLTKGKNWVLLANKQAGSMTTNAIAMKLADMVGTRGANHIVPVELYINDEYRGSYNFTEKVGFANNSIDLLDESRATMLELDSYYDEAYKFRDACYNLYVNIKEPDFSDAESGTILRQSDVETAFNNFTYDLQIAGGDVYTHSLDVDAFVRAWFVNDFVRNQECKHPKSWFLYNEDITADSLWTFGPVWDFDWSYGYDGNYTYFQTGATSPTVSATTSGVGSPFFYALTHNSDVVKRAYYRLWTEFLRGGGLDHLLEYCDDYFDYASSSLEHNATRWSDGRGYAKQTTNAKKWLADRAQYIYENLETFDLTGDLIETPEDVDFGQPDRVDLTKVLSRPREIYTLGGVRLNPNAKLMPGIYIIDGRKAVVR